jgi:hypothetical protein
VESSTPIFGLTAVPACFGQSPSTFISHVPMSNLTHTRSESRVLTQTQTHLPCEGQQVDDASGATRIVQDRTTFIQMEPGTPLLGTHKFTTPAP